MMNMSMTRWAMGGVVAFLGMLASTPETAMAGDWSFGVSLNLPTRTVDREWVPAVYEDREVCVEVPAVVEYREVPIYGRRGRIKGYRKVCEVIKPAYTKCHVERVLVRDGYHRDVSYRRSGRHTTRSSVLVGSGVGFGVRYDKHDHHRPSRRRLHHVLHRASHRSHGHHGHRSHRSRRY